jgi:hypothetical protein
MASEIDALLQGMAHVRPDSAVAWGQPTGRPHRLPYRVVRNPLLSFFYSIGSLLIQFTFPLVQ